MNMRKSIARYSSRVLSVLAVAIVTPASWIYIHNPKVPQELLKK
jgi:cyclic lactone autoinducer peptide